MSLQKSISARLGDRALVTGVAGFVGSHLAERLRAMDIDVVGIDDFSNGLKENISGLGSDRRFQLVRGSILNDGALSKAFEDVDSVFHMAAQPSVARSNSEPWFDFQENALGTFNVLEAARKNSVKTVIFASSSTVYGSAKLPTSEDEAIAPISNYGASKAAAEVYCHSYGRLYGINTASLRYYNIFGPRGNKGVMFDFFKKLQKDPSKLEVLGTGKQKKDYIYIDDTLDATILVATKGEMKGGAYNVGSGEYYSVIELVRMMLDMLGLTGKTKIKYTGGVSWPGDVQETLADISKIKRLGYSPKVGIEEGMKNLLGWFESEFDTVAGTRTG